MASRGVGMVRESAHFDRPVTPLFQTTLLPAMEAGHRAASIAQGGAAGALRLQAVQGWVYASWEPLDAPPVEDAPDVFTLVEAWERERVPQVHERLARMRDLARPGLPARRVAAGLDELQRHLADLMRLLYDTGFATQGATATLEGFLRARGDPAPALTVATLLSPAGGLLRELDAWLAECSAAPRPLEHARASPFWATARERPAWLDLDAPTWGEDEAALERALRMASLDAFREGTARALGARERAEAEAVARFAEEQRPMLRAILDALRRARSVRQTLNFLVGEASIGILRQAWLRAGAALASVGILGHAEDVVWLERDEVRAALLGEPLERGLVERRRAAHRAARGSPPPSVLGEVDEALLSDPRMAALLGHHATPGGAGTGAAGGAEVLWGLGASPGVVRGPARVARTEAEVEALRPGEVLVVASLLPAWTSAMQRASGIVTETGGMLSHGAVVAREMGVPAVVGVAGVTRRVRSGQEMVLDGASGEVAIEKGTAFST